MDLRRLRSGELLAGASAIALLAVMFSDWFAGHTGWESLTFLRVPLVITALLALAIVVLTVTRTVAMACSAAGITVGVGGLTLLLVLYRVVVNEPGPDAAGSIDLGAYLGVLFLFGCVAGAWRTLADERTDAPASIEQTERVLAVRGTPRPAPPARDPGRPAPKRPTA
ncbi:MAG: hypothetical protein QOG15_2714 [Solirubrobacteraceae bacterium]|jgi:hypothetical protein|nr:hypothetical protein [Solirubrobacteraceae bacterium]